MFHTDLLPSTATHNWSHECACILKEAIHFELSFLSEDAKRKISNLHSFDSRTRSRLVAANHKGEICGFVDWASGSIDYLFVRKSFRKSGIGKKLFLGATFEQNIDIEFLCFKKNPNAFAFYTHIGCIKVGERLGSFFGSHEENHVMRYAFAKCKNQ